MSSSLAAPVTTTTLTTTTAAIITPTIPSANQSSHLAASRATNAAVPNNALLPHPIPSQFREIHKNTWLKRLTAEGKKITVGAKKSERSWVVFCVHDDTIALLEGYAEPRLTGAHMPEWIISLQDTLHISHGLIPNSHEFEFVVTLSNEVVRFHAMSWDIMQEWVTTLRSKLREMKIISPRENLYTKLPEVRAPLLPTRDPTSPLPAPPPVPAAIVPGVERVIPQSATTILQPEPTIRSISTSTSTPTATTSADNVATFTPTITASSTSTSTSQNNSEIINASSSSAMNMNTAILSQSFTPITSTTTFSSSTPNITAMSNTLTQNLLNMLSDPISNYSEQINDSVSSTNENDSCSDDLNYSDDEFLSPILRKSCAQLLQSDSSVRFDVALGQQRASADHIKNLENLLQCERLIPRPQTSRSQSVGAADKSNKKQELQRTSHSNDFGKANTSNKVQKDNVTEFEISNGTTNLININENDNENNTSTTAKAAVAAAVAESSTTTTANTETNITIIQVSTNVENNDIIEDNMPPELLPKKSITADVFKFPEAIARTTTTTTTTFGSIVPGKQHEYKSNVQIIPSNTNSSTIQVLTQDLITTTNTTSTNTPTNTNVKTNIKTTTTNTNQYSSAIKKGPTATATSSSTTSNTTIFSTPTKMHATENHKVTTVHVAGSESIAATTSTSVAIYGTCYTSPASSASAAAAASSLSSTITTNKHETSTPKLPKKIILTANSSGITNITVNNNDNRNSGTTDNNSTAGITRQNSSSNLYYEKVFLTSNIPILSHESQNTNTILQPMPIKLATPWPSPRHQTTATSSSSSSSNVPVDAAPSSPHIGANAKLLKIPKSPLLTTKTNKANSKISSPSHSVSPAMQRRRLVSPPNVRSPQTINQQQSPAQRSAGRHPFLTRGLTEAAIMTRPSRKDLYNMKLSSSTQKPATKTTTAICNNNDESTDLPRSSTHMHHQQPLLHSLVNRTNSELIEQRRRSSSTSDAPPQRSKASQITAHSANNNELNAAAHGRAANNGLRIQQPPLPFRSVENGSGAAITATNSANNSPGGKRMTLREQQVMQLRREIMHPGGVRLQLRRKDCVGSIAWVDAFGAVWVAGWKQKEHPVLYNALHIGDQLISIAGINTNTAAETNKIIRNTNTLFVEVLVRRIPFGRGYAIRREREGQCLGLIRDGNTSTIVDVVPNSLAARHGLPPKAQSCDGTTLTFWVLTEINGRPLNLFFKENEIRDRLNSVGRDISILVQPSDLITKLKKQLKSLRGYKDYLVQ